MACHGGCGGGKGWGEMQRDGSGFLLVTEAVCVWGVGDIEEWEWVPACHRGCLCVCWGGDIKEWEWVPACHRGCVCLGDVEGWQWVSQRRKQWRMTAKTEGRADKMG